MLSFWDAPLPVFRRLLKGESGQESDYQMTVRGEEEEEEKTFVTFTSAT